MGSWSQGIYDRGVREGLAQGRLELIKNSFNKFKSFDECINFFNITDKNEIKFLRENLKKR